jgi:putative DNA primase/helicase
MSVPELFRLWREESTAADYLVSNYRDKIRYNVDKKAWYGYKDYWQEMKLGQIYLYVKDVVDRLRECTPDVDGMDEAEIRSETGRWLKYVNDLGNDRKINSICRIAATRCGIGILHSKFDTQPNLVNLANGTYDLLSDTLLPHTPSHLQTKILPYRYDASAQCPFWLSFLDTVFDHDQDLIKFIQILLGVCLSGYNIQKLMFCYGTGENGKSIFWSIIRMVLSAYYAQMSPETLLKSSFDTQGGATPDLAGLAGSRFAVSPDIPAGRLDEGRVKVLTGGDVVTARFLYGQPFTYKPTHKIWIAANNKPQIQGRDRGIWRRILTIPFMVIIPPEIRRPEEELLETARGELSGIFNWCLQGWRNYVAADRKLVIPKACADANTEYHEEMDTLGQFLSDMCQNLPNAAIRSSVLYEAYESWSRRNGLKPLSHKNFSLDMKSTGWHTRRITAGIVWEGLTFKTATPLGADMPIFETGGTNG